MFLVPLPNEHVGLVLGRVVWGRYPSVVQELPCKDIPMVTLYQAYLAYKVAKKAHKLLKKVRQIQNLKKQRNRKAMPTKKQVGKGWCN